MGISPIIFAVLEEKINCLVKVMKGKGVYYETKS
jgi:hypothetical protein